MKAPIQRLQDQPRQDEPAKWQRYEFLKLHYAAQAASSAEYEAACRRAAKEAGV